MAVAVRILVEVVLMILLSSIEILQRQFFYGQELLIVLLFFGKYLLDNWQIRRVSIIDTCTIACALVVSLFIETCGINSLEKHLQQEFEADHIGIVPHKDGFCKACLVGIYLFIRRVLRMSVGESNFCYGYALNLFEVMFRSPETATCKVNVLRGLSFQDSLPHHRRLLGFFGQSVH